MSEWLDEKIYTYTGGSTYPFHIPGSKRRYFGLHDDILRYDITEIGGFDDLRHPNGILKELQEGWARFYRAGHAFLSVNGSTGSNLAVLFAAAQPGDKAAIVEGCHESVTNASYLRGWNVIRIPVEKYPEGYCRSVDCDVIESILSKNKDVRAVVLTSPTYEGIISDVETIAGIAHRYDAALVVDSAHGAHLGTEAWSGDCFYKKNAIELGADAMVVSLHKTLPVLGQVSLILLPKDGMLEPCEVKKYLNMIQTSSPSYLLMSSASCGLRFLMENGSRLFARQADYLKSFYSEALALHSIHIAREACMDSSKIIISTSDCSLSGEELMNILRSDYDLELEKSGEKYALAITTLMDTREGYDRLRDALISIDDRL